MRFPWGLPEAPTLERLESRRINKNPRSFRPRCVSPPCGCCKSTAPIAAHNGRRSRRTPDISRIDIERSFSPSSRSGRRWRFARRRAAVSIHCLPNEPVGIGYAIPHLRSHHGFLLARRHGRWPRISFGKLLRGGISDLRRTTIVAIDRAPKVTKAGTEAEPV